MESRPVRFTCHPGELLGIQGILPFEGTVQMRTLRIVVCILALSIMVVGHDSAQRSRPKNLEITQIDVFAIKGWDSAHIALFGVHLGMTRDKARLLLSHRHYILAVDSGAGTTSCKGATCWGFVRLPRWGLVGAGFGLKFQGNRVDRIVISGPEMAAETIDERVMVCKYLHGLTRKLAYHYSDALREKILGQAQSAREELPAAPPERYFVYYYPKTGLKVHVRARSTGDSIPSARWAYLDNLEFGYPTRAGASRHKDALSRK